jgi:hypothetical protein
MLIPKDKDFNIIRNAFPNFEKDYEYIYIRNDDEYYKNDFYRLFFFSVFDHWLTEEEYIKAPLFLKDKLSEEDRKQCLYYHSCFNEFYTSLYKEYRVYLMLYYNEASPRLLVPENIKEFLSYVQLGLEEYFPAQILIPEAGLILRSGFDLTHLAHIDNSDDKKFTKARDRFFCMVQRSNLFILPSSNVKEKNKNED